MITGQALEQMTDAGLDRVVEKAIVFARVSPSHKLRIVERL